MIHFHSLPVKYVRPETADCVSVTFAVPPELLDTFRFKQGQNLTIRKTIGGEELRRNYSICTSPLDGTLTVAIKKVTGGLFSTWANEELRAGDHLDVMPPTGKFYTELDPSQQKNYVAFTAGSGITPILSIIKTTLMTEPKSSFTLVYGNRSKASIIFKEDLEALKDKYLDRFRLYHVLSREKTEADINYGRIDADKCALYFDRLIDVARCDEFFLCGPEEMIFCVRDSLQSAGVPSSHIHFELFTVPGQKKATVETGQEAPVETGPQSLVTVRLDGLTFDYSLGYDGQSVLDSALRQGADLPYACKGGVCCTCKARLVEGEVEMDENWGLEPDEVAAGFILTCQSHPRTPRIVVDFDVK
ncbi:MAG: phenylacetic acid degradation protein [Flaviaesturariibacter sp.]|nr:phenylacetic acid degradation protein [Flaviaesturariibacter sp.]